MIKRSIVVNVFLPEVLEGYDVICKTGHDKKPFMKTTKDNKDRDISTCFGLIELQKTSITVKAWQEIEVVKTNEKISFFPVEEEYFGMEVHTSQSNGMAEKEGIEIVKLMPPIAMQCNEDINFLITPTPFAYHPVNIISGIINLKYNHQINCFMYFKRNSEFQYTFEALTPMYHLVPMSDRPLKLNFIYDDEKFNKIRRKYSMWRKNSMFRKMLTFKG